jgi:F0F1-type ATP synthase delta subunit
MSEELKKEAQEINIDEKINELLKDPLVKGEEEQTFIKTVGEHLKKGDIPLDLILAKSKESSAKMEEIKKLNPEFESFINHYQRNLSDAISQLFDLANKQNGTK